jgi:hypothetical protein
MAHCSIRLSRVLQATGVELYMGCTGKPCRDVSSVPRDSSSPRVADLQWWERGRNMQYAGALQAQRAGEDGRRGRLPYRLAQLALALALPEVSELGVDLHSCGDLHPCPSYISHNACIVRDVRMIPSFLDSGFAARVRDS